MAYLVLACRAVLALVLLAAALGKLRGRDSLIEFRASVRALDMVPDRWAGPVAGAVVVGELAAPALLAVPATTGAGFAAAAAVLASIDAAVLTTVLHRRRVPCRCFGASGGQLGLSHLVRNAVLTAAAVAACWASLVLRSPGLEPGAVALALCAAAVIALLVIVFDDLVSLFAGEGPAAS